MPPLGVTPYNQLPPYMMANPMYQAQQFQPYNAFSGVQTGNPLMNLGVQLAGPVLANAFGGTAMGMNGMPGGNLYNNIRMQNFSRNHIAMINRLGAANTQPFIDNVGGLSALADLDLFSNPDYASTIGKAASFAGGNSLTVDSFGSAFGVNNLMDKLTGGRNIAGLASGISMAGRNRYDPRTGRLGMSAGSAGAMAEDLYEELGYARGPNAWRRNTDGFGAGAMGDLFGEMSTRGMLSPESSASAPGAGPDWRKFGAGPKSGSVDTNKVKSQLQDMTKALSAVREIFGDAGITNAPMGQLMSALENITQGGVYQIDKEKVGLQLRTMREAANAANIGMGGAFQMMMAGNRYADQLGLVPTGAWTIPATTEAINFGLGLEASGAMAIPAWGRSTPEQLVAQRQSLYLRNAKSNIGNSMGAMSRISQQFSGNEELAEVVRQIQDGTTPTLGGKNFGDMSQNQVMEWVAGTTGMELGEVEDIFRQRSRNEEFTNELGSGAARVGFAGSRREFIDRIMGAKGGAMHQAASAIVRRAVGDTAGAAELAEVMSGAAGDALRNMSSTMAATKKGRNMSMGAEQDLQIRELARDGNLAAQKFLKTKYGSAAGMDAAGGLMYGAGEQYAIDNDLIDPSTRIVDYVTGTAHDAETAARKHEAKHAFAAMLGAATAGETMQPGIVANAVKALQEAGHDDTKASFKDMALTTLGIEKDSKMGRRVAGIMGKIYDAQKEYDTATSAAYAEPRPEGGSREEVAEWERRTNERAEGLAVQREALSSVYDEFNDLVNSSEGLRTAVDEAKAKAPGIDGEDGSGAAGLSFDIAKVSIALGSSEIEFSSPTVEVEVSGGRGDKTPPATKGGGGK